jgi:o-succinylbenzoate---CoA ligase
VTRAGDASAGVRVAELLRGLASTKGAEAAVLDGAAVTTWAELDAMADAAGEDVVRGAVVPIEAVPSAATIARLIGVRRAGGVAAPLSAALTAREREAADEVLRLPLPSGTDLVVMTSGTTAEPRGVAQSEAALAASSSAWRAVLPPATGWVLALGLAHVAGLGVVWRALTDGVPIRFASPNDAAALLEALRDPAMSHVSLVPTQLERLLDHVADAPPPANILAVPLGGGVVPAQLVRRATAAGWPVVPTYGLSEMGSGVTALPAVEAAVAPGSAGRPLPGVSLRIADPDADGVGEVVVGGPMLFLGYLGDGPGAAGREFRTGDLGRLDDEGRLVVVDRRTDRIVRGGENIAPAEVEAVLAAHPVVADAGVVARRDAALGQVPVSAVVLRAGADDPGDEALAAWCRASLAGHKVPVSFTRLDVLPRGASGKLRRSDLRALLDGGREGRLERPGGDRVGWRVTGDGPRQVLLLHGTLSSARQLDRLAALLAEGCGATVHALDRRGSGTGRLATPRPLDVAVHVADLAAYLDARGIARADLVGVSFGGALALEAAWRLPERFVSVAAYEPPYGPVADGATQERFAAVAADLRAAYEHRGAAAAAEVFLRGVAGDAAWERLPERSRALLEAEGDGALADGTLEGLDPAGLDRIAVPVLLLTGGASDPFYAPIVDALARRIPGAVRATLGGLAHPAPITRPGPVADAIRAFLEPIA